MGLRGSSPYLSLLYPVRLKTELLYPSYLPFLCHPDIAIFVCLKGDLETYGSQPSRHISLAFGYG